MCMGVLFNVPWFPPNNLVWQHGFPHWGFFRDFSVTSVNTRLVAQTEHLSPPFTSFHISLFTNIPVILTLQFCPNCEGNCTINKFIYGHHKFVYLFIYQTEPDYCSRYSDYVWDWTARGSNPLSDKRFFSSLLQTVQTGSGTRLFSNLVRVKRPECKVNHSPS
jgi:hypothetical protein